MFSRQVSVQQYEVFQRNLDAHVFRDPMDVTYRCDLSVNGTLYRLHLCLGGCRRLLPIQAVRMERDRGESRLITDPILLGALTELVLAQYSGDGRSA